MSKSFGAGQSHGYDRLELFQAALNASFVDPVIEAQKPMIVMYSVRTKFVLYMGWSHHGCKLSQMEVLPEVKVGGVVVWSGRR